MVCRWYLTLSFPSNPKESVLVQNLCLLSVMDWMRVKKLELNPTKTEFLVSQKDALDCYAPLENSVNILAVHLNSSLSLHVKNIFVQLKSYASCPREIWLGNSDTGYLSFGLLQCDLGDSVSEVRLEISAGTKCCNQSVWFPLTFSSVVSGSRVWCSSPSPSPMASVCIESFRGHVASATRHGMLLPPNHGGTYLSTRIFMLSNC